MFDFFKQRRQDAIRHEVEAELKRAIGVRWENVSGPRDRAKRAEVLERAVIAGLGEDEIVCQLDFLHRLLAALLGRLDLPAMDALVAEAVRYQLAKADAVKKLVALTDLALLADSGLRVVEHDSQNRVVYLRS